MVKKKYPFPKNNLNQKITFSVSSSTKSQIEKRCQQLKINTISDYVRTIIEKDLQKVSTNDFN